MILTKEYRSTEKEICPSATSSITRTGMGLDPVQCGEMLAANRLNHYRDCDGASAYLP
jgi:hypothetical protein